MTDSPVTTPEQAAELPVSQWVWDANGDAYCLVDTNVGWPQRMWMSTGGTAYTAIERIDYPLTLAYVDEDEPCPHAYGTNECGHCKRCGVVSGPAKDLDWNIARLT